MKIYIFGNGNISFDNFKRGYIHFIEQIDLSITEFILADFRGTDVLAMEYLKTKTPKVTVYHIGERPRYFPDKFRTHASEWKMKGNYTSDNERDLNMIKDCTHFLAIDYNSDEKRKSGTTKNIEMCLQENKIDLREKKGL